MASNVSRNSNDGRDVCRSSSARSVGMEGVSTLGGLNSAGTAEQEQELEILFYTTDISVIYHPTSIHISDTESHNHLHDQASFAPLCETRSKPIDHTVGWG